MVQYIPGEGRGGGGTIQRQTGGLPIPTTIADRDKKVRSALTLYVNQTFVRGYLYSIEKRTNWETF